MMGTFRIESPWNVDSLYEFQYFDCPKCPFKHKSKQEFVHHTFHSHPESVEYFKKISDQSVCDILCPWNENYNDNNTSTKVPNKNGVINKVDNTATSIRYHKEPQNNVEYHVLIKTEESVQLKNPFHPENLGIVQNNFKIEQYEKHFHTSYIGTKNKGNIRQSVDTNHEDQDNICKSCGKLFSSKTNLKKHMHTIHEGHKDYKCDFCNKLFNQEPNLKKHVYAVHVGHKPFKCECGKLFSQKVNMNRHKNKVHGGLK